MHSTASLRQIHQGMKVIDSTNKEIGEVEMVMFGDDDPSTPELESSGISPRQRRDSLIDNLAAAFRTDELPEEIREKLLHQGFIRVDVDGLFAADRFVLPDQIGSIAGDAVTLTVTRNELMKRP